MFNAFSGCRISENLLGEAQLEREKPAGHLWSVSGGGCGGCIYRASVLNRQRKRGGGKRRSLFGSASVSACKE